MPIKVQPSNWRLWMSCRLRHPRFTLVSLDYLMHSFGGWGCVSVIYSPRVGLTGPALVRFHVIKKTHGCNLIGDCNVMY